jgi:hypothetical protein
MTSHSLQNCADLLAQVFGEFSTISFKNSVEIKFKNLSIGIWNDRGLYSVTIGDERNMYVSSAIASFFDVEICDAEEDPNMLIDNLIFIRDRVSEIKKLINENDFANRYKTKSGYNPVHTRTRA